MAVRDRGVDVILVTHNPHHTYPIGDRFVVLNKGRLMGSWTRDQSSREDLTFAMAGGNEFEELAQHLRLGDEAGLS